MGCCIRHCCGGIKCLSSIKPGRLWESLLQLRLKHASVVDKVGRSSQPLHTRGCCVATLEEPGSPGGSYHLIVNLTGTACLGGKAVSLQYAPLNQRKINFQSQQASRLLTEDFLLRSHCFLPVPQMKARIVGGCRRAPLLGGRFRCSAIGY